MKKWSWIIAIVLVAGLGYGGFSLYRRLTAPAETTSQLDLETVVVERGDLRATVSASGSVEAEKEVQLSFPSSGEVAEVWVEVGDVVEAGQPLARLKTHDLEDAVAKAKIALAQAKLDLKETLDGASDEDIAAMEAALRAAEADYAGVVDGATANEIAKAEAALEQAEADLASAQSAYDRTAAWKPYEDPDYSSAANQLWSAQAAYEKALASYHETVNGATETERWAAWASVQKAQANLDRLLEQPTEEAVRLAEIAVAQAELDLAQAEYDLAQATLTTPMAGVVTAVNVEAGEVASGVAVVISTLDALTVEVVLDETEVAHLTMGQPAEITLDAFDDVTLSGTVAHIAPTANIQSGVVLFPVTIALDPTDMPVRVGMTADVEIITVNAEDVLLVPAEAVQSVNGRTIVLRKLAEGEAVERPGFGQALEGAPQGDVEQMPNTGERAGGAGMSGAGGFIPVPVEVGARSSSHVEIISGLEAGDEIVLVNLEDVAQQMGGQRPFGGGLGMMGRRP
ncbi:MAG: efflux RND transporter periplasmic adaptor subunit [Anaerolineae bacterium]